MGGYPSMVLIMSYHAFFFNRKIASSSSVSVFIARASNLIMKSAVFFFPCLKDSILHSASAVFVLLLNMVLISLMNSSRSWVSNSSSNSSSFFWAQISATSPLRWARIAVILLSVSMTLLLLRNNWIHFYQSSNFVWSPSNHSRFGTMLFGIIACVLLFIVTGTSVIDISLSDCLYIPSEASFA